MFPQKFVSRETIKQNDFVKQKVTGYWEINDPEAQGLVWKVFLNRDVSRETQKGREQSRRSVPSVFHEKTITGQALCPSRYRGCGV